MLLHLLRHDIAVDRGNGSTFSDADRRVTTDCMNNLHLRMVRMQTPVLRDPFRASTVRAQP
jgi:hypothetical protein